MENPNRQQDSDVGSLMIEYKQASDCEADARSSPVLRKGRVSRGFKI